MFTRRGILLALFILLLLGIPYTLVAFRQEIFWNWRSAAIEESKSRGLLVVKLIGDFRKENGRLPRELDELVPKYASALPLPTAGGKHWEYRLVRGGESFMLSFGMPEDSPFYFYPNCAFSSRTGRWYLDE
jgi:hypothetical protein